MSKIFGLNIYKFGDEGNAMHDQKVIIYVFNI